MIFIIIRVKIIKDISKKRWSGINQMRIALHLLAMKTHQCSQIWYILVQGFFSPLIAHLCPFQISVTPEWIFAGSLLEHGITIAAQCTSSSPDFQNGSHVLTLVSYVLFQFLNVLYFLKGFLGAKSIHGGMSSSWLKVVGVSSASWRGYSSNRVQICCSKVGAP